MSVLVEAVGWLGAGLLLLAYGLLSTGRLTAGHTYQALNLAGSVALAVNAIAHRALPSAAVNLVWLVIGVAALHSLGRKQTSNPARTETGRQVDRRPVQKDGFSSPNSSPR